MHIGTMRNTMRTYAQYAIEGVPITIFFQCKQREREHEQLFKSHFASWSLEIACRKLRIWLETQLRLHDDAQISTEDFGGTQNRTFSFKLSSAQHMCYLHRLWDGRRVGLSFFM
jgi:hypothetical protein